MSGLALVSSKVDVVRRKKTRTKTSSDAILSSLQTRRTRQGNYDSLSACITRPAFTILLLVFLWYFVHPIYEDMSSRDDVEMAMRPSPWHNAEQLALKQGHELLSGRFTTTIESKLEWLKDSDIAYPVRDVLSSVQMCPDDEDFNMWIRARAVRWHKPTYLAEHKIWQPAVGDKIGGYLFARKMGVRVPHIEFCSGDGPVALTEYMPPKDRGFVVKNIFGHSSRNVYVMKSGFGGANLITQQNMSLDDVQYDLKRSNVTDIYVEELVDSGRVDGTVPDDYKFYTFNGKVANIRVIRNRGTERFCMAFYDEEWNRHYQFGCFRHAINKPKGNKTDPATGLQHGYFNDIRRFCSDLPPPKSFPKMLETAKRLSERIGIFMRIDMFENADGEVVLGEFTPFSAYGVYHCAAKVVDGCIDSCFLGRLWKENSLTDGARYDYKQGCEKNENGKFVKKVLPPLEGGPITPAPEYLKDWDLLTTHEKCARVKDL